MALESLISVKGAHKRKKLLGRGPGSGHGKTSTRGHKGQKSRSGRDFYLGFEGGQSPLIRRIPKRGFYHKPARQYQLVNLEGLNNFAKGLSIDSNVLAENRLIENSKGLIKILGEGRLTRALTIRAHKFSKGAIEKIEKAGGKIELIK
ncbi:MAG: 50S ribosomal protein L15 [Omnitrophica WOR_2 bacterium RIFCSPHIGHO2_02_FULL_45_21]|nr:MAG: 50S ribosomal protein L15 [Omnitrophica WOR_2 bacterium RIFCSPHIGHO2_02_FULL_45_21]